MRALLALAALAPLLPGPARAQADVEILEPGSAAVSTRMPLDIALELTDQAVTSTLRVWLNGADITSAFQLSPPAGGRIAASAGSFWDAALVLEGENRLSVRVDVPGGPARAVRHFATAGDPYADAVVGYSPGTDGGFKSGFLPGIVLGPPEGAGLFQGGLDVVSLGLSGEIVVEFTDNLVVDGPGVDFIVFENAFLEDDNGVTVAPFMEPARVAVSQDGVHWAPFSACALDPAEAAEFHPGCAGVYPVLSKPVAGFPHASIPSEVPIAALVGQDIDTLQIPAGAGGDAFDLAEVGLAWARFVRIESAGFATSPAVAPTVGADLDAVAAVHSVPGMPVPAAPRWGPVALGLALAGAAWRRLRERPRRAGSGRAR